MSFEPMHRDEQLRAIEGCIRLASKGMQEHLFLYGPAGSGRTFCVSHVLSKHKPKTAYVDCRTYKTRAAIITKILIDLGNPVPRRGVPLDYLYEKLVALMRKQRGIVVVLDDAHMINKRDMEVFSDLQRLSDTGGMSLIAISMDEGLLPMLDAFLPVRVWFQPYTKKHLMDIMRQDMDVPVDAIESIADYACSHKGNCRLALECLRRINQRSDVTMSSTLKFLNELRR